MRPSVPGDYPPRARCRTFTWTAMTDERLKSAETKVSALHCSSTPQHASPMPTISRRCRVACAYVWRL
eukprot:1082638-Prymnesium_polylepis.1